MAYNVQLLHEIKDRIPNVAELLDDVTTIDQFCERIEATALKYYPADTKDRYQYKGDLLELFTEFLINSHHAGAHIGITDYKPWNNFETDDPDVKLPGPDYGIDGVGKSTISDKWAVAQVKYRQTDWDLKYSVDHLGNLKSLGIDCGLLDGIRTAEVKQRTFFITTAGAMHRTVLEAMCGTCHYLDRTHLATLCDNHKLFWDGFKDSINASKVALAPNKPKILREHQQEAVLECLIALGDGVTAGQVILPTGTGKTLVIASILNEFLYD